VGANKKNKKVLTLKIINAMSRKWFPFKSNTYRSFPTASTELKLFFISEKFFQLEELTISYHLKTATAASGYFSAKSLSTALDTITILTDFYKIRIFFYFLENISIK
jgi:hypothetical protein